MTTRLHQLGRSAAVAALLLAAAACAGTSPAAHNSANTAASGEPSTTSTVAVTRPTVTTHPTEQTPAALATPTPIASPSGPASLVVSPAAVDIVDPGFDLIDTGGAPITFTIDGTDGMVGYVPNSGRIVPGGYAIIRLDVNYPYDVYKVNATINIHWNGQVRSVPLTGRYDTGPGLSNFRPPTNQMCPGSTGVVAVDVVDYEGIKSVTLNWIEKNSTGAVIAVGAPAMSRIGSGGPNAGGYQGTIGRLPADDPGANGQLLWYVTAYDGGDKVSPDSSRHEIPLSQHC